MRKTYEESLVLRTCNCDLYGAWRPGAVLEAMQETAGAHSALLGLTTDVMRGMGVAWVLSRTSVQMQRMPHVGESIRVETWPMPNRHLFFPRTHVFIDARGETIGAANSLWVLMDIASRKITQNAFVIQSMPDNRDLHSPLGLPATVRALSADAEVQTLMPQFTEFDTNGHVNNTKYLDWCLNALGMNALTENCVMSFTVNYDAEILPDTAVQTELRRQDDRFTFVGFAEGKQHFAVGGTLAPRA